MKITRLEIKDFHQFKYLELDLTYPLGHEKEGQPLDKVCIIGQSGTGKTTLIELLGGLTYNFKMLRDKYELKNKNAAISVHDRDIRYNQLIADTGKNYAVDDYSKNGEKITFQEFLEFYTSYRKSDKPNLIYYPAELKYGLSNDEEATNFKERTVLDFSLEKASGVWNLIIEEIQAYQEKELQIRQEISRLVENDNDIDSIREGIKKLEEWKQKNFNPIVDLADNCLNPILKRFNLQVKTDLDIKKKDDIGSIKIEDFNKNEISYNFLSTGTKQVITNALPLYLLGPKEALIFFDEPERSLYPDIQREIVSYYESLVTNCQMFFATHSPIIASSFEPWEIVELKFNEDGKVFQEKYYDEDKGRHVDNYNVDPNYLTIDLILSKIFDLKETHSPIRNEKITEVLMLRNMLEKLKSENKTKSKKFKEIYQKYQDLASKLSWEFEIPMYAED